MSYHKIDDKKKKTKHGLIDREGNLIFDVDENSFGSSPPYFNSGRFLIYKVN